MLQPGQWIRYYTTSLRGEGVTTHIGAITKITTNKDGEQVLIRAGYAECNPRDVIAVLEVDLQNRRIISEKPYGKE